MVLTVNGERQEVAATTVKAPSVNSIMRAISS